MEILLRVIGTAFLRSSWPLLMESIALPPLLVGSSMWWRIWLTLSKAARLELPGALSIICSLRSAVTSLLMLILLLNYLWLSTTKSFFRLLSMRRSGLILRLSLSDVVIDADLLVVLIVIIFVFILLMPVSYNHHSYWQRSLLLKATLVYADMF